LNCPYCKSELVQKRGIKNNHQSYQCQDCKKYFTEENLKGTDVDINGSTFTQKENSIHIVCDTERIMSQNDIIKQFNIDLNQWAIKSYSVHTSEGYRKDKKVDWHIHNGNVDGDVEDSGRLLVVTMYHVSLELTKKVEETHARLEIQDIVNEAKSYSPKYSKINYPKFKNGMLYEISMPDAHFGRLTWGKESGEDFDLKIAENMINKVLDELLLYTKEFPVSKILFPIGNDYYNADNKMGTTTAGTPQQNDSRWQKTFKLGRQLAVNMLEKCSQIAPTDCLIIKGNHDEQTSFYLGDSLESWFHNNPNVKIDNSPKGRKYYSFGNVLLGFTHGYWENLSKLSGLMPLEVPELWGKSTYREFHTADKHHRKDFNMVVDEFQGVTVRILPSLTSADAWTFDKGFVGNVRAAQSFLYDPEIGLKGQFTAQP